MTPPIRPATAADIPDIWRIRMAVTENLLSDPGKVTRADADRVIADDAMWVWDEAGEIQGFSAVDTRDGSVWALFVAPGHDGRGIGRALLARACQRIRAAGWGTATLSTGAGTRAEGFYRKAGWIENGRSPQNEIVFRLEL
ncbi:MAG: N-acetyltransferase family protein [Alphaproteobacteria bacterium]